MLGAGQGKGLQSQQPWHEIGDPGSSLVQWRQWLWVFHMGEIFCLDFRQIDFTGGAQQPLLVVGMREREKANEGHQPE